MGPDLKKNKDESKIKTENEIDEVSSLSDDDLDNVSGGYDSEDENA